MQVDEKSSITVDQILDMDQDQSENDGNGNNQGRLNLITPGAINDVRNLVVNLPGRSPAILDSDLAKIYGTSTRRLNEQLKRNTDWFDSDFYFELTKDECLVANCDQRGGNNTHLMFNHYGCNAASFLIRTPEALKMRKVIIKVFTELEQHGGISVAVKDFGQIVRDALAYRLDRNKTLTVYKYRKLLKYIGLGLNNAEIGRLLEVSDVCVGKWKKGVLMLQKYSDLEGLTDIQLVA